MDEVQCTHTVECNLATKEWSTGAVPTWVNLENIMENKRIQTQKFCVVSLHHSTFVMCPKPASLIDRKQDNGNGFLRLGNKGLEEKLFWIWLFFQGKQYKIGMCWLMY